MGKERITKEERHLLKSIIQDLDLMSTKQVVLGVLAILAFKKTVTDEEVKEIIEDAKKLSEL